MAPRRRPLTGSTKWPRTPVARPPLRHDAVHPAVGVDVGPRRHRVRDVGDVDALLGPGGAPEGAHPVPLAVLGVAGEVAAGVAQAPGRLQEEQGVAPHHVPLRPLDEEVLLHRRVEQVELGLGQLGQAGLQVPALEDVAVDAQAGAGVDGGGAAHRLSLGQQDHRQAQGDGLARLAVEAHEGAGRAEVEVLAGVVAALLQDDDRVAGLRQLLGGHAAPRPRADDDHVGGAPHVPAQLLRPDDHRSTPRCAASCLRVSTSKPSRGWMSSRS